MKAPIDVDAIRSFGSMRPALTLQAAMCEADRCLLCEDAPCSQGCPAGTDPGRFIRQIRFQNFKGAARTIRKNNALGATCARICPTEKLCEAKCSATAISSPIDISGLQRFAVEYGRTNGLEPLEPAPKKARSVAIVGAGPAGLACAAELAMAGYTVTVLERDDTAGGVPRWNIPDFRLPREELAQDVAGVEALGVTIETGTTIDSSAAEVLVADHDAVVVATGLDEAFGLPLLEGATNAHDYIAWLRDIKHDKDAMADKVRGSRVVVIGGGSVALDVAVSTMALGAKAVHLVALEHLDELPADGEEIALGRLVHVDFRAGSMLTGATREGDTIVAVEGTAIEWKEPGRFSPDNAVPVPHSAFTLGADHVVQAIGTRATASKLFPSLEAGAKGCFEPAGEEPYAHEGKVFAVGDVVNRGTMVVQAVGEGKTTARAVMAYLEGGAR